MGAGVGEGPYAPILGDTAVDFASFVRRAVLFEATSACTGQDGHASPLDTF